jgi:hypothetical protein
MLTPYATVGTYARDESDEPRYYLRLTAAQCHEVAEGHVSPEVQQDARALLISLEDALRVNVAKPVRPEKARRVRETTGRQRGQADVRGTRIDG